MRAKMAQGLALLLQATPDADHQRSSRVARCCRCMQSDRTDRRRRRRKDAMASDQTPTFGGSSRWVDDGWRSACGVGACAAHGPVPKCVPGQCACPLQRGGGGYGGGERRERDEIGTPRDLGRCSSGPLGRYLSPLSGPRQWVPVGSSSGYPPVAPVDGRS